MVWLRRSRLRTKRTFVAMLQKMLSGMKIFGDQVRKAVQYGKQHQESMDEKIRTVYTRQKRARALNRELPTHHEKDSLGLGDIAVRSKTTKSINQDACASYQGQNCSAVVIADGLGSSFDAHIASTLAARSFLTAVQALDRQKKDITMKEVKALWKNTADTLKNYYERHKEKYADKSHPLQTTMATILSLEESYMISYIGNGSILYVRGDFWHFWDRRWPWCVTDFMVGHSFLEENGKETLYGILTPQGLTASVRLLQVSKDPDYGEILVLCSDGISSPDYLRVGYDANQKLWMEVNPHLERLLNESLRHYFEKIAQKVHSVDELNKTIAQFLQERTFDDDATLGIFVSQKAIDHYCQKNAGQTS